MRLCRIIVSPRNLAHCLHPLSWRKVRFSFDLHLHPILAGRLGAQLKRESIDYTSVKYIVVAYQRSLWVDPPGHYLDPLYTFLNGYQLRPSTVMTTSPFYNNDSANHTPRDDICVLADVN